MKNKFTAVLLSVVIAFGLWLYVVNNVSQEDVDTFYNIPIVMEGESVLNERGMMITGKSTTTATLRLSGSRSDLSKVNSSNITLKADLSKIYEPGTRISVDYTISFPGDVAQNAFTVESRSSIYLDVEYRREKEVPVTVKYVGERSEDFLYDTENAVLDYPNIKIIGPASVADLIASAVIEVDLTEQKESLDRNYRYTLCDKDGNAVDAAEIVTNTAEVRVQVPIRAVKEISLQLGVTYGGGATTSNTAIEITPSKIRVSGSETALDDLGDVVILGKINLAEILKNEDKTFPISLPEGVTNETGISEAQVSVKFNGLTTREFSIDTIRSVNVPDGMKVDIITEMLTVSVRGPAAEVAKLTDEDISLTVDFTNAEVGTFTFKATAIFADGITTVGTVGPLSVSATVQAE